MPTILGIETQTVGGSEMLSQILADGTSILNSAWSFISGNALLLSICGFGLIVGAVRVIRKMI